MTPTDHHHDAAYEHNEDVAHEHSDVNVRTLQKCGLLEVTLTSIPAYDATSVSVRSLNDAEEAELRSYYESMIKALTPAPDTHKRDLAERLPKALIHKNVPGEPHGGLGWNLAMYANVEPPKSKPFGRLIAWDPVLRNAEWTITDREQTNNYAIRLAELRHTVAVVVRDVNVRVVGRYADGPRADFVSTERQPV